MAGHLKQILNISSEIVHSVVAEFTKKLNSDFLPKNQINRISVEIFGCFMSL